MGIAPILERQPGFPKTYLGFAQTAFFGGRTSAHIRKVPVPVIYVDFLSMYPTVNSLMELRRFLIAREIGVEHCKAEIERFLKNLTPGSLFCPKTWKRLPAFVKVIPNGDLLPSRAKYNVASNDWQVALNFLYAADNDCAEGLWFSLPDVAASVLLTGKIPKIIDAFKIVPSAKSAGLRSILLGGEVPVNPGTQDVFRSIIEQRKSLSTRKDLSEQDLTRLDKALKVLANATSYGIFAEMNRQESEKKVKVRCYGLDWQSYQTSVMHPEQSGEFCFPPLASLITGAARLMLALLEHTVSQLGGTYVLEDTDSMAIVATERQDDGGHITPGRLPSWSDTETIEGSAWRERNDAT